MNITHLTANIEHLNTVISKSYVCDSQSLMMSQITLKTALKASVMQLLDVTRLCLLRNTQMQMQSGTAELNH